MIEEVRIECGGKDMGRGTVVKWGEKAKGNHEKLQITIKVSEV